MTWLTQNIQLLTATAVAIGFVHTVLGPDHYLPFVAVARQRRFGLSRTLWWTGICGLGHCVSSIVLGAVGIAIGIGAQQVEALQAVRGDAAAWLMMAFGLVVLALGLRHAARTKSHSHLHVHSDGVAHSHHHDHNADHVHVHEAKPGGRLYWSLFVVFLLGPCEMLVPVLMYPAAQANYAGLILVTLAFTVTTIVTMLAMVAVTMAVTERVPTEKFTRLASPLAGLAIIGCAGAMLAGS